MTDLAKLVVRLEAQTSNYQAQLETANRKLSGFQKSASGLLDKVAAGFAAFQIGGFIKSVIDGADRMNDLAKQTGITVESLSQLQFAAEQNGSDLEGLAQGLKLLAKNATEARDGTGGAADAFEALGVKVNDASGQLKSTDTLLAEVADRFSKYEDGAAKSAAAQAIFGKSGAELIPLLNQGAKGLDEAREAADRLGITMSTSAAQAADDFNDKIAQGKAQLAGFVREAIAPLLPQLTDVAATFLDSAAGADQLAGATKFLQTGLKLITDIGISVAHTFRAVGKDLGALAAAAVSVAKGEFSQAREIFRLRSEDDKAETAATNAALVKLWSDGTDDILAEVQVRAQKIRQVLDFGGTKKKGSGLELINVTALKTQTDAMTEFYDKLNSETQTSAEKQLEQFARIEAALVELRDAGKITADQFQQRYSEALDAVLSEVEVTAEKIGPKLVKPAKMMSESWLEAARNVQDILGDELYNIVKGKFDNILESFGDMLLRMATQAQAAKIGDYFFGTEKSGGGALKSGGGFLQSLGGILQSIIGPGRANGGPVYAGTSYPVNENTPRSEVFTPSVSGRIDKGGGWGGGMTINNNFVIQAPQGTVSRQTQTQIAAAAARSIQNGSRRGN